MINHRNRFSRLCLFSSMPRTFVNISKLLRLGQDFEPATSANNSALHLGILDDYGQCVLRYDQSPRATAQQNLWVILNYIICVILDHTNGIQSMALEKRRPAYGKLGKHMGLATWDEYCIRPVGGSPVVWIWTSDAITDTFILPRSLGRNYLLP